MSPLRRCIPYALLALLLPAWGAFAQDPPPPAPGGAAEPLEIPDAAPPPPSGPRLDLKGMHKNEIGELIAMWMDGDDRARMLMALESNEKYKWDNKATNATYSIAFAASRETPEGTCRDFVITAKIAVGMAYFGGACRKPDGSWSTY